MARFTGGVEKTNDRYRAVNQLSRVDRLYLNIGENLKSMGIALIISLFTRFALIWHAILAFHLIHDFKELSIHTGFNQSRSFEKYLRRSVVVELVMIFGGLIVYVMMILMMFLAIPNLINNNPPDFIINSFNSILIWWVVLYVPLMVFNVIGEFMIYSYRIKAWNALRNFFSRYSTNHIMRYKGIKGSKDLVISQKLNLVTLSITVLVLLPLISLFPFTQLIPVFNNTQTGVTTFFYRRMIIYIVLISIFGIVAGIFSIAAFIFNTRGYFSSGSAFSSYLMIGPPCPAPRQQMAQSLYPSNYRDIGEGSNQNSISNNATIHFCQFCGEDISRLGDIKYCPNCGNLL
ncbi:MAG: hypothetical protein ACTSWN_10800 [Promethearchaeota archaeon]